MASFDISSPKFGIRENTPTLLLEEGFLAKDSRNITERYGEYGRVSGRTGELLDADRVKVKTPINVYAITGVAGSTFTIAGNNATTIKANVDNDQVRVNGSTGNDKLYTFVSATDNGANTDIVVSETPASAVADGNLLVGATPIIKYHRHVDQNTGTEYLLLATIYHIWLWTNASALLTVKYTTGTPTSVERWNIVTWRDNVYATNNVDFILWWNVADTASNDFVNLDDDDSGAGGGADVGLRLNDSGPDYIVRAKYLFAFTDRLVIGYYTDNDGDVFTQNKAWHSIRDAQDWNQDGSGDAGEKTFDRTPGFITGFARHGDDLIIAKSDSMERGWIVTSDTVWEWAKEGLEVGCLSDATLVNDREGRLYWLATDFTIREFRTSAPLSRLADVTVKNINAAAAEFSQATYIDELNLIWFAVPISASETNNAVIEFNPETLSTFVHDQFDIRAFGDYTAQTSFQYDTLPYSTYAAWGAAWGKYDIGFNVIGFPLDLASDYNGNTFSLHTSTQDDGSDFSGNLRVATDFARPHEKKRINNGVELYLNRKTTGSVTVNVSIDGGAFQQVGTGSLVDSDEPKYVSLHLPFNVRGKHFVWEVEGANAFEFLRMTFVDFVFDGFR